MIPKLKEIKLPLEKDDKRITSKKQYLVYDCVNKYWQIAEGSMEWYGWSFSIGWTSGDWKNFGKADDIREQTYTKMFELPGTIESDGNDTYEGEE